MRGPRNFRQGGGGGGQGLTDNIFLVLILFYGSQMVNFKENYHFLRFNIFQGGGSNCIVTIGSNITCDFSGGGVPPS